MGIMNTILKHVAVGVLALGVVGSAIAAEPPLPEKLGGERIKADWFDGKAFTSTAPDGTAFTMTFRPDGKATRKPVEKGKAGGAAGFWRVIAEGYCSRWSGQSREKCFNVRPDPAGGAVIVRFGKEKAARWTRSY